MKSISRAGQKIKFIPRASQFVILFSLALSACHTFEQSSDNGKVNIPDPILSAKTINALPTRLTSLGENARARFNVDGSRIIFQGYDRPAHKNSQIYIINMNTLKERRVTFNDGEDSSPAFDPTGRKIIYASTTDESKEHPENGENPSPLYSAALQNLQLKLLNYDIYQSDVDGSHIQRLTHSKGYDGDCSYSLDGLKIIYTSVRDGTPEIYTMDADGKNQHRVTTLDALDGEPALSPHGTAIVWREGYQDKPVAQLYKSDRHGRNSVQLTTKEALHLNPSWSPDGTKIVFSSNRGDGKNFSIYQVNTDGTCLKQLTNPQGSDLYPTFSPDGKKLLFTSNRNGKNQIYIREYFEPTECSPEKP